MTLDPRTPVLVGVGQVTCRDAEAPEPTVLLAEAARIALADSGGRVLRSVSSIRVVRMVSRSYPDPARLVAGELGLPDVETVYSYGGGQTPQVLVAEAAVEIQRGRLGAVLIGGAESWRTRRALKRRGVPSGWMTQGDAVRPDRLEGTELRMASDDEVSLGFRDPVHAYPLFEVALRHRLGRDHVVHLKAIGELWARFSDVAARNPHAALRRRRTPEEIVEVTPGNRLVCSPYRKLMVANDDVDQAAALLLCSAQIAEEAGVPRDRWVFLHGYGSADDTPYVTTREDLSRSPAIRAAGRAAFASAAAGPDDIAYADLYSCFPSAVQIAAEELGFSGSRSFTVTGGLTFAGGPWHNYVTHSIATMVGLLREDEGALGLCTANGGFLTKHAIGIYGARPSLNPVDTSPRFRAPSRPARAEHHGPAVVEASTVVHARDGVPERAFVACLTSKGERVLAVAEDSDVLGSFVASDRAGETVRIAGHLVRS